MTTNNRNRTLFLPRERPSQRRLRREAARILDEQERRDLLKRIRAGLGGSSGPSFFDRVRSGFAPAVDSLIGVPGATRAAADVGSNVLGRGIDVLDTIPAVFTPTEPRGFQEGTLAPRTFVGRDQLTPAQRRAALEAELEGSLRPGGPTFSQVETPRTFSVTARREAFQQLPVQTQIASGLLFDLPVFGPTDAAISGASAVARTGRKAAKAAPGAFARGLERAAPLIGPRPAVAQTLGRSKKIVAADPGLRQLDESLDRAKAALRASQRADAQEAIPGLQDRIGAIEMTRESTIEGLLGEDQYRRLYELDEELRMQRDSLSGKGGGGSYLAPPFGSPERDLYDDARRSSGALPRRQRVEATRRRRDQIIREIEEINHRLYPAPDAQATTPPLPVGASATPEIPPSAPAPVGSTQQTTMGSDFATNQNLGFQMGEGRGFVTPRGDEATLAARQERRDLLAAGQTELGLPETPTVETPTSAQVAGEVAAPVPSPAVVDEATRVQGIAAPQSPPRPPPPPSQPPVGSPPLPPPGSRSGAPPPQRPPEDAGNVFLAPLRDLDAVADEVVSRPRANVLGINPSLAADNDIKRAAIAYQRQLVASESLADAGIAAGLRTQLGRFSGRLPVRINRDGLYANTGVPWNQVFSNPSKYELNAAEREFIDAFNGLTEEVTNLRLDAGLRDLGTVSDEFYVPRQVQGIRGVDIRKPSNPKFNRLYEDASDGFAAGVRYDGDPIATIRLHIRAAYREIAQQQLDEAVSQLGVRRNALVPKDLTEAARDATRAKAAATRVARKARRALLDASAATLPKLAAAARKAESDLVGATEKATEGRGAYSNAMAQARSSAVAPGNLFHKDADTISIEQWRGRFFPAEDVEALKAATELFQRGSKASVWRATEKLANTIRFLASVGDFAAPLIQGLPVLARNPVAWGRASWAHYQAWFDIGVQARYIRDNIDTFQEMARHGIPIGDVEFFRALERGGGFSAGELIERLPKGTNVRGVINGIGRQSFGRFQSSYNTFLTMSRGELWKAMKPSFKGTDAELAAVVRNMTGGLDSRALGVGPAQRSLEGMLLAFSPRLLRSTIAMVADLRHGPANTRGIEAWRTLGSLVGGATSLYFLTGVALGKPEEEIRRGLNPLSGKYYLAYEINGDLIGVGAQVRAITQLGAGIVSAAAPGGKPIADLATLNRWENPLTQFWMFRGAPALNIATGVAEQATGTNVDPFRDITSLPDLVRHIGTSALPFSLQGALEGEEALTVAAALMGARTSVLRDESTSRSSAVGKTANRSSAAWIPPGLARTGRPAAPSAPSGLTDVEMDHLLDGLRGGAAADGNYR